MQLLFLIAFGALLGTSSALSVDENGKVVTSRTSANIRLVDIIQINLARIKNQCICQELAKVEKCLAGHIEVFGTYTGAAKCSGETVVTAFGAHINLLKRWSTCASIILRSGTTSIIRGLSALFKLGESEMVFLTENGKATPQLIAAYTSTVESFNGQIGLLYRVINGSLKSLEKLFADILKQFLNHSNCKQINFKAIMNAGRLLAVRLAVILETALPGCGCTKFAESVYEALAVISLLTYDIIMAIQAVLTTMASIIIKKYGSISSTLAVYLDELNSFTLGINETIVLIKSCEAKDVKSLLQTVLVQLSTFGRNLPPCPIGVSAADVNKYLLKA